MTTTTLTLTEFLLARIAEDEETFRWGRLTPDPDDASMAILRWDDLRGRVECEAKRRIVGEFTPFPTAGQQQVYTSRLLLSLLALPYADHPDYREEWRA